MPVNFFSGTEHERIISILKSDDIVFDVCAGVGPFSVPAMMLGCEVFSNDINPECYKWLNVNFKRNKPKKAERKFQIWNLDGREFLQSFVFPHVAEVQQEETKSHRKMVVLMNLPALALTFFDVFSTWLLTNANEKEQWTVPMEIYCYTFSREDDREQDIRTRLKSLAPNINDEQVRCRFVRQVAPNKDMFCVQIDLFKKIKTNDESIDQTVKRFKKDSSE